MDWKTKWLKVFKSFTHWCWGNLKIFYISALIWPKMSLDYHTSFKEFNKWEKKKKYFVIYLLWQKWSNALLPSCPATSFLLDSGFVVPEHSPYSSFNVCVTTSVSRILVSLYQSLLRFHTRLIVISFRISSIKNLLWQSNPSWLRCSEAGLNHDTTSIMFTDGRRSGWSWVFLQTYHPLTPMSHHWFVDF